MEFSGSTCGAATEEGAPPPAVVFHCQLEVGQSDGDEGRHNDQDDEHDAQDGVDGVHLQTQIPPPHSHPACRCCKYNFAWEELQNEAQRCNLQAMLNTDAPERIRTQRLISQCAGEESGHKD